MMDEAEKELGRLGFPMGQHILDGFGQGALLDFRVRFAMQLLGSTMFSGAFEDALSNDTESATKVPGAMAAFALKIADELFDRAKVAGMVSDIDHAADLSPELIAQAKRIGAFNVYQQVGAQEAMKKEQPRVASVAGAPRGLNG